MVLNFEYYLEQVSKKSKKKKPDPCWSEYEQFGTKKKKGKKVPNCILIEESENEKVTLNKPTKGTVKKYKVKVKNPKTGKIKTVHFGDPNMEIKRDDPKRRKSFRARHKCDEKKDKTTPGYWSCKFWGKTPVSKLL